MRRGTKLALLAATAALALPAAASAQDHTVSVIEPENLWDTELIEADPGQSVLWRFRTPEGDPLAVPHDVQLFAGEEPSGDPLANSGYHLPGNPDSPQSLEYEFNDEGTFTYICSIHEFTMRGTVQVGDDTPPPVGDPKLYFGLKRKRQSVRGRKPGVFTPRIQNRGDGPLWDGMVCAKAPRRFVRVTGGRCASYAQLEAGEGGKPRFKFKPTKRARGKKVRIKFVATGTGVKPQTERAILKVRR